MFCGLAMATKRSTGSTRCAKCSGAEYSQVSSPRVMCSTPDWLVTLRLSSRYKVLATSVWGGVGVGLSASGKDSVACSVLVSSTLTSFDHDTVPKWETRSVDRRSMVSSFQTLSQRSVSSEARCRPSGQNAMLWIAAPCPVCKAMVTG